MAIKTVDCAINLTYFNGTNPGPDGNWKAGWGNHANWEEPWYPYTYIPNATWGTSKYYRTAFIRLKTPADLLKGTDVKLIFKKIPVISCFRSGNITLRLKRYDVDPTGYPLSAFSITHDALSSMTAESYPVSVPTGKDETYSITADRAGDEITFTLADAEPATYYYIMVCSDVLLQLSKASLWNIDIEYQAWTAGGSPTLAVTDNKNNTVTLSGTVGKAGDQNALSSVALYYTTDGSNPKSSSTRITKPLAATSGTSYKETIDLTKNCTVKAYTECTFKYNTTSAEASTSATFYPTPLKPASVKLEESSLKNNRLILKQPWTFTWSASANAKGYFIMLMKCPEGSDSWEYIRGDYASSTSDDYITIEPGANNNESLNYFTKRQSTSCTAIFKDPSKLGISPGDKIRLRVKSFNIDGAGNTLQGDGVENTTDSPEYLVQNAGVVNVKVGGKWVEGQVWVKVNNEWKEAETVSTKVNGYWKESQ